MVKNKWATLILVVICLVLVLGGIYWMQNRYRMEATYVSIAVTGLSQDSFKQRLRPALKRVDGVRQVAADYEQGVVTITFHPDATSRYDLADVIDTTGHEALLPKANSSLNVVDYKMFMR